MNEPQGRSLTYKERGRFSFATVEALLAIGPCSVYAAAFVVATALGDGKPEDGERRRLHRGESFSFVRVNAHYRDKIKHSVGLGKRDWERYVTRWVKARVAHRCKKGEVALFPRPLSGGEVCLSCGERLGSDTSCRPDATSSDARSDMRSRVFVSGSQDGNRVGTQDGTPSEVLEFQREAASNEDDGRAQREISRVAAPAWPEPPGGYKSLDEIGF